MLHKMQKRKRKHRETINYHKKGENSEKKRKTKKTWYLRKIMKRRKIKR